MLRLAALASLLAEVAPRGTAVDMIERVAVLADEVKQLVDAMGLLQLGRQQRRVNAAARAGLTLPARPVVRPAARLGAALQ